MKEVSYEFVLEMQGARMERTNKRFFITTIILLLALVLTNLSWVIYETQYESRIVTTTISADQEADGNGQNYIVGGDYADKTEGKDSTDGSYEGSEDGR